MANPPVGFVPMSIQGRAPLPSDYRRHVVRQADPYAIRVGDAVSGTNDSDASGVTGVTLATGSGAVRGVVGAIEPASVSVPFGGDFRRVIVPAVKTRDYYVWVLDDPDAVYALPDDGLTPANLVAGAVGKLANFTPNITTPDQNSTTALASGSIGTGAALKVLRLAPGSAFGAFGNWLVRFALHELGSALTANILAPAVGAPAPAPSPSPAPSVADTRPRFGYAAANPTQDQTAFAALFATMTPLTGSANGGRAGTFATAADSTKFVWVAVLHSAAPNGVHISDSLGPTGFSGALTAGLYTGTDTDPLTIHGTFTNTADGNVWDMYRGDGKAVTYPTFTLS